MFSGILNIYHLFNEVILIDFCQFSNSDQFEDNGVDQSGLLSWLNHNSRKALDIGCCLSCYLISHVNMDFSEGFHV